MQIQIVNKSDNPNPTYQTKFSAGMDLMSYLQEPIIMFNHWRLWHKNQK